MKPTIKIFVDKKLSSTLQVIHENELALIVDLLGSRSDVVDLDTDFGRFYKWWNGVRKTISQSCTAKRTKFEETNRMAHFVANV